MNATEPELSEGDAAANAVSVLSRVTDCDSAPTPVPCATVSTGGIVVGDGVVAGLGPAGELELGALEPSMAADGGEERRRCRLPEARCR
ncbi:MAG: hypothetical protein R3C69_07820 [Geminicoccaceae bacterium]